MRHDALAHPRQEGRICSRDQNVDRRMVKATHEPLHRRNRQHVIDGRDDQDRHQRGAIDRNRDHRGRRGRCDDAHNQIRDRADAQHDSEHMNQAIGPELGAIEVEAPLCRWVQFMPFRGRAMSLLAVTERRR